MNWEAISAVGEFVGAMAVVVTLVYLAVQVRRGTAATQAATVQSADALDPGFLLTPGSDSVLAKLRASYIAAPHALSVEPLQKAHFLMGSLLRRLENIHIQQQRDTLSKQGWRSRQSMFNVVANSKGYAAFLDSPTAAFMNADFARYMAQMKTGG